MNLRCAPKRIGSAPPLLEQQRTHKNTSSTVCRGGLCLRAACVALSQSPDLDSAFPLATPRTSLYSCWQTILHAVFDPYYRFFLFSLMFLGHFSHLPILHTPAFSCMMPSSALRFAVRPYGKGVCMCFCICVCAFVFVSVCPRERLSLLLIATPCLAFVTTHHHPHTYTHISSPLQGSIGRSAVC